MIGRFSIKIFSNTGSDCKSQPSAFSFFSGLSLAHLDKHFYEEKSAISTAHTNLEHVECFKLNVGAFISQQVHHQLEIFWFADVFCHDGKVVSVQNQFAQQL